MSIALFNNYQKFTRHYKDKGLLYATYRGFKYGLFLVRKNLFREKLKNNVISKGRLKIVFEGHGIKIYWNSPVLG